MSRVGVEEPATVGAQLLDRLLRRDRAALNDLLSTGDRGDGRRVGEVLDDPAHQQHDRRDDREWQQDADDPTHEVDPEVADPVGAVPRDATDQGDGHGEAHGGRDEVLHGETHGLHGVARAGLTGVRLPVGVRHERDGGVQGGVPVHRPPQRPRQPALHHDEQEERDDRDDRERDHGDRVAGPPLVGAGVDADDAVEGTFHAPVLLVGEDPVDPRAQRHVGQGQEHGQREHGGTGAEDGVHGASSEPVRADQCVEEVAHEGQPHGSSDDVFPHAFTTHPGRGVRGGGDAALTPLDATLTPAAPVRVPTSTTSPGRPGVAGQPTSRGLPRSTCCDHCTWQAVAEVRSVTARARDKIDQ